MADTQRMIGATCTGCEQGSSKAAGTVQQVDLGSANKWHPRCYRQFTRGKRDRLQGNGCKSANGQYLNGWYSIPCGVTRVDGAGWSVRCTICETAPMTSLTHVGAVAMAETHNATHERGAA